MQRSECKVSPFLIKGRLGATPVELRDDVLQRCFLASVPEN